MTDSVIDSGATGTGADRVHERLAQASGQVAAAQRLLRAQTPPGPAQLHAMVHGTVGVTNALADLVAAAMRQVRAALDHSRDPILHELLADLRATHGCLTTGQLLLAPAIDDLYQLAASQSSAHPNGGPVMPEDAVPAHEDFAEQHIARPEPDEDDQPLADIEEVLEADLADVADQHRPARPEPGDDQALPDLGEVLEADPTDVADQHRDAPVLEEGEPWP